MSSDNVATFDTADAGAALTYPQEAGALRKGHYAMLKGKPCKVIEISVSKTGKHGHAKCHIVGTCALTGKKCEDLCPSTHNMECPNVARTEYQLMDLDPDSGSVSCLLENGDCKDDLNLPTDASGAREETAKELIKAFEDGKCLMITVLKTMGQEKIVSFKESA